MVSFFCRKCKNNKIWHVIELLNRFFYFLFKIFAFIQSWTTFYHEGYEKHIDYENRFNKSHGGIQALRNNFDYFKSKSTELISNILKDPDFYLNSYETTSSEQTAVTFKQGYLYLLEKSTFEFPIYQLCSFSSRIEFSKRKRAR